MMRHPLEGFVKAELAYRTNPRNPGMHDELTRGNGWRSIRLGRRRRNLDNEMVTAAGQAPELEAVSTAQRATVHLATIHPIESAPRRPAA